MTEHPIGSGDKGLGIHYNIFFFVKKTPIKWNTIQLRGIN